jgi:hypothetical protein
MSAVRQGAHVAARAPLRHRSSVLVASPFSCERVASGSSVDSDDTSSRGGTGRRGVHYCCCSFATTRWVVEDKTRWIFARFGL